MSEGKPRIAIVTGGSGYIGGFLLRSLRDCGRFERVYNFDLAVPAQATPGILFRQVDLRDECREDVGEFSPTESWIFNLAAACREPGFEPHEYFDINVGGAKSITAFAARLGIANIFFTSTMSSYGRMERPTPEDSPQYPETPYGVSKAIAEWVHRTWLAADPERSLIICRPSVIFGPGDKENIPRMLRAVRKGYFVFPGSPDIVKGYGYVHGLIDSIHFTMALERGVLTVYNYADRECLSLRGMVETMGHFFGKRVRTLRIPVGLLVWVARALVLKGKLTGKKSAIHPVRVRKVAFPTNLKPQFLIEKGFEFKYPLDTALRHWKVEAPSEL